MDLKLPDDLLLEIFRYLPLNEQCRISRVNRRFYLISKTVISETKTLDLDSHIFDRVSYVQLSSLIHLCSPNLRIVTLTSNFQVVILSQFTYQRLVQLEFSGRIDESTNVLCRNLIRNSGKLRILHWFSTDADLNYPNDVVIETLTTLKLWKCTDATLISLTGRCPNLKNFCTRFSSRVTQNVVDSFFASCPNIQKLDFFSYCDLNLFDVEAFKHFWRLTSLSKLRLDWLISDNILVKITDCFPSLEVLDLRNLNVSNRGIASLSSLQHLRKLKLTRLRLENDINEGLRELRDCKQLRHVTFDCSITSKTLIILVRLWPELQTLTVNDISDVNSLAKAIEVVQAFNGLSQRQLTIQIKKSSVRIWNDTQINRVLEELKEKNGSAIEFC